MKFMKNWKRFWTLNAHHDAGFTLVELIVVIAILAILATVAVPAYSGSVKKAQESNDIQLLGTINTAFAAACLSHGTDINSITSANISLNDDGTVDLDSVTPYGDDFAVYFAGNENVAFKVYESIAFFPDLDCFAEGVALAYGNTYVSLTTQQAQALKNSSFGNLTGSGLATEVATLTGLFGADPDLASDLEDMLGGADAAAALLVAYTGKSIEEIYAPLDGESPDDYNARINTMYANAAVLSVASTATNMDTDHVSSLLTTGSFSGTSEEKMAQAAMAYGMYTAYVNSNGFEGEELTELTDILYASQNDEGFAAYLKTEQANTDMSAFLSTLQAISDNSGSTDVTSSIILNGFDSANNPELTELLEALLGN